MNELVFQNATSIPSKQVTIPAERIFGSNKPGFGKSEFRLNQMEPNDILKLLTEKFTNLSMSKRQKSHSFYSGDSDASTQASSATFVIPKKPVRTRMHIPVHKNHYAQIQLDIEKEREERIKKTMSGTGDSLLLDHTQQHQQQTKSFHQDKSKLQRLKLERMAKKRDQEEQKPVIERINEANNEFLKNLYELKEDLITPQQQKYKNTVKYKQTYQSSFKAIAREDMKDLTIKNKYAPGPGDYDVSRIFEAKRDMKKKLRSISMQYQGIPEENEEQEDRKISEMNMIKNKLNKALNIDQELEKEAQKNELSNLSNQTTNHQSQNTSFMFIRDDRDRFGDQIFPLSSVLPVPGPGKYEQNYYSMEKRLQGIQSQEEQKRLLKIWLHPSGKEDFKSVKASQQQRNQTLDPAGPIHLKHY